MDINSGLLHVSQILCQLNSLYIVNLNFHAMDPFEVVNHWCGYTPTSKFTTLLQDLHQASDEEFSFKWSQTEERLGNSSPSLAMMKENVVNLSSVITCLFCGQIPRCSKQVKERATESLSWNFGPFAQKWRFIQVELNIRYIEYRIRVVISSTWISSNTRCQHYPRIRGFTPTRGRGSVIPIPMRRWRNHIITFITELLSLQLMDDQETAENRKKSKLMSGKTIAALSSDAFQAENFRSGWIVIHNLRFSPNPKIWHYFKSKSSQF